MRLLFDLESDQIDPRETSVIHCAEILDLDTNEWYRFGPGQIAEAYDLLAGATVLAGHNIVEYDLWVLDRHAERYTGRAWRSNALPLDTKYISRVMYPGENETNQLLKLDFRFRRKRGASAIPAEIMGHHSLEAWGYRLRRSRKLHYTGGFEQWSQEMQDYCHGDVQLNHELLDFFLGKGWPIEVLVEESLLGFYLRRQFWKGVGFNQPGAVELFGELTQKKGDLARKLALAFPEPEWLPDGKLVTPKRDMLSRKSQPGELGYRNVKAGCVYQKMKLHTFDPGSDDHIRRRLIRKYGWVPTERTRKTQEPRVTDEILRDLPYPEAKILADYKTVTKVLGFVSEGRNAWLRVVGEDGRIHCRMNATGTLTNRCSHKQPNVSQTPTVGKPYGKECRSLFVAAPGKRLVGVDASGLQLALYAHFVGRFDGGAFARVYEEGDPHEYMRSATGLFVRYNQKTWTYAKWFGAQPTKLGSIVLFDMRQAQELGLFEGDLPSMSRAAELGRAVEKRIADRMAGYKELQQALDTAAARRFLIGLDGRRLPVVQKRLALNVLLMGNEAVVMKLARVIAEMRLEAAGFTDALVLWVHDEFQAEVDAEDAPTVGEILASSIVDAGRMLHLRLTLKAEYKIGRNWAETH